MRIGGLATGMDIDQLVNKLMEAERMPLDKMHQDRQTLEWKRDGLREINRALKELGDLVQDMHYSRNYRTKKVTSSQEGAVTATASGSVSDGNYRISVEQLATTTMLVGGKIDSSLGTDPLDEYHGTHYFYTYDEKGEQQKHSVEIKSGDTLKDVLKQINDGDSGIRAFYDEKQQRVIMESTRTGSYKPSDLENVNEIEFLPVNDEENVAQKDFFTAILNLKNGAPVEGEEQAQDYAVIKNGQNAVFTYNDALTIESQDNSYELNGIRFDFHNTTEGNAQLVVQNDTEEAFDNIMKFVDKYNEVIEILNKSQMEERYRDFPPLTDEQKEEMTEDQIKKWEEKAKSGLLRGEGLITNTMYAMRSNLYEKVETDGKFNILTQLGLETSKNYLDGGKIVLKDGSPETLKKAIEEDIDGVMNLFTNSSSGGLMQKLKGTIDGARNQLNDRAGRQLTTSLDSDAMGKQLKGLDDRIDAFQKRLVQVESRYWNQFTAMEKAIQRMNMQSAQLMQQFGGGM